MNFEHLKKHADYYTPIIALGHVMSHKNRKFFERFFFYLTIVLLFLSLGYVFPVTDRLIGSLMLSASLWVVFFAVEAFYYSFYFASEKSVLGGIDPHEKITYELSEIIHNADENHITQGFLESKIGLDILLRLGITEKDIYV